MTDKERIKRLKEKAKADAKALKQAATDLKAVAWYVDQHNFGLAHCRAYDGLNKINKYLGRLDR